MNVLLAVIHSHQFQLALAGFVVAAGTDLHTYSDSPEGSKFNWGKAVSRWVSGAIGASGIGGMLG
jgi:hypothetical protein